MTFPEKSKDQEGQIIQKEYRLTEIDQQNPNEEYSVASTMGANIQSRNKSAILSEDKFLTGDFIQEPEVMNQTKKELVQENNILTIELHQ
jgi:hypothetical protein